MRACKWQRKAAQPFGQVSTTRIWTRIGVASRTALPRYECCDAVPGESHRVSTGVKPVPEIRLVHPCLRPERCGSPPDLLGQKD